MSCLCKKHEVLAQFALFGVHSSPMFAARFGNIEGDGGWWGVRCLLMQHQTSYFVHSVVLSDLTFPPGTCEFERQHDNYSDVQQPYVVFLFTNHPSNVSFAIKSNTADELSSLEFPFFQLCSHNFMNAFL